MGWVKNVLMPELEAPWACCRDSFVCGQCLDDYVLAEIVKANAEGTECDFCGRKRRKAFTARLSCIVKHMYRCVCTEWNHPAGELPYESAEGGFIGHLVDGDDILSDIGFQVESYELYEQVLQVFNEEPWCRRHYYSASPVERQQFGWDRFKDAVKHERRYTFWSMGNDSPHYREHPAVGEMLEAIVAQIRQANLVRTFRAGKVIWRVRVHDSTTSLSQAHELAPPPIDKAVKPNRMSPAGIVMFYGAEDFTTASVETIDPDGDRSTLVTGVRFRTTRTMRILDLYSLPESPSFFDLDGTTLRHVLHFLDYFARDLSRPVRSSDHADIDYVPTQAFTEYVRFEMKTEKKQAIDGIRYRSSRNGRPCYVLFCGREQCLGQSTRPAAPQWLAFDSQSLRSKPVKSILGRSTGVLAKRLFVPRRRRKLTRP